MIQNPSLMTSVSHNQAPESFISWMKGISLRRFAAIFLCAAGCSFFLSAAAQATTALLKPVAIGMATSVTQTFLPKDDEGRTNILLLGIGGAGHAGANLTDTIIVASVQPGTRSVSLLSLPRDLYLADAYSPSRINELYANALSRAVRDGATESGATVIAMRDMADDIGERLNLHIHGIITIDFTAFTEIVDAFGGVDIDVPEALTDYSYPLEEGVVGTFSIDAGLQHLDGETALRYARSRHSTSDFDRSARQHLIMQALLEKAKNLNLLSDFGLMRSIVESVSSHAEWTFSSRELIGLAGAAIATPRDHILSRTLSTAVGGDGSDAQPGGLLLPGDAMGITAGAVLVPYSTNGGLSDWSRIQLLAHLLFSRRELFIGQEEIALASDPRSQLQVHRLRNELVRYGFNVAEKIEKRPVSSGVVILAADATPVTEFLSQTFDAPLLSAQMSSGATVQVELGDQYRFEPLQLSAQN